VNKKRTDKERIDFLGRQDAAYQVFGFGRHWEVRMDSSDEFPNSKGKTLRQAIDAAMDRDHTAGKEG
jgi:hypothetical protein